MQKVILISGKAGSGKDTVANIMRRDLTISGKRVLVTHFASLLKFVCTEYFDWNGAKDERGRTLLQHIGTDVVRKQNPDFWVDFVITMLDFFGDNYDVVIIPDLRFPNELLEMTWVGFPVEHVRIESNDNRRGLNSEQAKHESETALDEGLKGIPVYTIRNDGDLNDLKDAVARYLEETGL